MSDRRKQTTSDTNDNQQGIGGADAPVATKATMDALRGVFRKLAYEHGELNALMIRVSNSTDPAVRDELFPMIRAQLLAHEAAEREVVYAELAQHPATQPLMAAHAEQAAELHQRLHEVCAHDSRDDAWIEAFDRLVDAVLQHARTEEREFFPRAQACLGEARCEQLQPEFEAVKSRSLAEHN